MPVPLPQLHDGQLSPSNTAAQRLRYSRRNDRACLDDGQRVLPADIRLCNGKAHHGAQRASYDRTAPTQTFIHNQPSLGYSLTVHDPQGCWPGSGPAFTFVGAGGAAARWASGFLTDVSFENIGFDSWDRQFLFGGTSLQGVAYSKFNNLYGTISVCGLMTS